MTTIFTCGSLCDRSIRDVLPDALAHYGGVQYFSGEELLRLGEDPPRFVLYEWEALPQQTCGTGILLFKNSFAPTPDQILPKGLIPVLEARNTVVACFLRGTGTPVVTCGTSPRDTLSVASLRADRALVSLQRCVTTLDGRMIEPGEILVALSQS